MQKQNLKERKIKMGRVKSYYFDNLENDIGIDEDTMQEDEKLVFEEQFDPDGWDLPTVNPEFKDFDWDTPIKDQPWYTPSTEMDLDRDVPDEIWESKN